MKLNAHLRFNAIFDERISVTFIEASGLTDIKYATILYIIMKHRCCIDRCCRTFNLSARITT
jgi:hypothetical protein